MLLGNLITLTLTFGCHDDHISARASTTITRYRQCIFPFQDRDHTIFAQRHQEPPSGKTWK